MCLCSKDNIFLPAVNSGCEDVAAHEVTPGRGCQADRQRVPGQALGAVELSPGLSIGVVAEAELRAGTRGWGRGRGRERGRVQEVTGGCGLGGAPGPVLLTRGRGGHVFSAIVHPRRTPKKWMNAFLVDTSKEFNLMLKGFKVKSYEVWHSDPAGMSSW